MRRIAGLLLVLVLVSFAACKDATKPDPTLAGRWSGTFLSSGTSITIDLVLAQTGSTVTGSGTMSSSVTSVALTVTGTCTYPNVSLTLASTGFNSTNFTGTFANASTLTGALNGSGYVNVGVAFTRQP